MAFLYYSSYKCTTLSNLHPPCYPLWCINLVPYSTTYEEPGCNRLVMSALHTINSLVGLHLQWRSLTYLPAITHRHYLHQLSHISIRSRSTVEAAGLALPLCQETGTAHLADRVILGFRWLSLILWCSILVWQLPIIKHRTDKRGALSYKWQRPLLDKPHDDGDSNKVWCKNEPLAIRTQKWYHYTHNLNFASFWQIFQILSLQVSAVNQ